MKIEAEDIIKKPEEDRRKIIEAKRNLYHIIVSFNPALLTNLEVNIGFLLAKDDDIQDILRRSQR